MRIEFEKNFFSGKFEKNFFLKIVKNFLVDFRRGGGQLLCEFGYVMESFFYNIFMPFFCAVKAKQIPAILPAQIPALTPKQIAS